MTATKTAAIDALRHVPKRARFLDMQNGRPNRSSIASTIRRWSSSATWPTPKAAGCCTCSARNSATTSYRRCIKTYLERHQYDTVVTEDLNAVIEELSGRSFDQFFDQWVYHAHHPELEIAYSWEEKPSSPKSASNRTKKLSEDVLLFNFPLTVRFKSKAKTVDRQITVKEKAEDFYFALEAAPELVRIDPNYTLLAKISFNPPNPMLYAQLADKDDMMGRLLAVLQLAGRKDKDSIAKLKQALNNDSFYGIRLEASKVLRSIHTDDARKRFSLRRARRMLACAARCWPM